MAMRVAQRVQVPPARADAAALAAKPGRLFQVPTQQLDTVAGQRRQVDRGLPVLFDDSRRLVTQIDLVVNDRDRESGRQLRV